MPRPPNKPQSKPVKTRRSGVRAEVAGYGIRGLLADSNGVQTPFILWDLAEGGIRVWVPNEIELQLEVKIIIAKPVTLSLSGQIAWCSPTSLKEVLGNGYDCGIQITERPAANLLTLLNDNLRKQNRAKS